MFQCPLCQTPKMDIRDTGAYCPKCAASFDRLSGYLVFITGSARDAFLSRQLMEWYSEEQVRIGARLFHDYLRPVIGLRDGERVLDVGCGVGCNVQAMRQAGYEAYGIDLPNHLEAWRQTSAPPDAFFCADGCALPFCDNVFDTVMSFGVVEHIGSTTGGGVLREDYWDARRAYARELVRVCRPGGRILVACPNLRFPIDIQHPPPEGGWLRKKLFAATSINLHWPMGRYHLLSFGQIKRLFCHDAGASDCSALPLRGYFGFSRMRKGVLGMMRSVAAAYVNNLPKMFRPTALNPYVCVMIRK